MALLSWLDRVARLVRPETVVSGWVLIVVVAVLVAGMRRQGRAFRPGVGLGFYLILSSLTIALAHITWVPVWVCLPPAVLAIGALGWWLARGQRWTDGLPEAPPCPARTQRMGLWLIVLVTAGLLAIRLTTYAGSLLTWEPSVIEGFGADIRDRLPVSAFAAQRLLWQEGLVSSSHDSLLFGVPVFALWRGLQPSLATLRLVALVWALIALVGVFVLGRRIVGPTGGLVAAAALGGNALLFYYGRYGVSLTATFAAVLIAAWLTMRLADPPPVPWWQCALTGMALLAATLAYSPARLVVVMLLGLVVLWAVVRWRPWSRRHTLAMGVLGAVLAAGVAVQVATGHAWLFSHARGEQLVNILTHPDFVRYFLGYEVHGRSVTAVEAATIVARVVHRTLPQYLEVLAPVPRFVGLADEAVLSDPPALPLLAAPLAPFALLGLARALRRWRQPSSQLLLAWFGSSSAVLLLTTRADAHRMWLLVVPMTIWAADGLLVLGRLAVAAGLSAPMRGLAAGGLGIGLLATAVAYAVPLVPPAFEEASAVIAELERREGPFHVSGEWDKREAGRVELYLLSRFARKPTHLLPPLPQSLVEALEAEGGPRPEDLAELRHALRSGTVVIGPLEPFAPAARRLAAMGYEVQPCAGTPARAWCIDRAERPVVSQPTLPVGPEVPLSSLVALDTQVGFEPPRFDTAWVGGPIRLAGIPYEHGIGMHAWCRLTYPVPEGARYFRSLVGIDDSARECARALVMVSVLGDDDTVLYESDLMGPSTPPVVVAIPVAGRRSLTLVVGEGGNGRDCDHVSWAEPMFILGPP